jgi:hypothetical protein
MLQRVVQFTPEEGFMFETELVPLVEPFLRDHAREGIPLLPGVMGVEAFVEAAQVVAELLAGKATGLTLDYLDDIQFLAPLKFYRDQPRRFILKAHTIPEGDGICISVRLESLLERLGRQVEPVLHFSGQVHLQSAPETAQAKLEIPQWQADDVITAKEIYRLLFHGPAFQGLEGVRRAEDGVLGLMKAPLPPLVSEGKTLLTNARALELALQTAGVWEAAATSSLALPSSIGWLKLYPEAKLSEPLLVQVKSQQSADDTLAFSARVVDANGDLILELCDYRTAQLPFQAEAELTAPFKRLVA